MDAEVILNLSPTVSALAAVVVFVAAFARGYLGFGFSSILMLGLLPVVPASQLVPLSVALEILASSSQAPRVLPDIQRRYLAILLSASAIGVPAGVYLLSVFPELWLRMAVYSLIFVTTLISLISIQRTVSMVFPSLLAVGLVAGMVNGATALSGLVLALFFASSSLPSHTMRATIIAYLFFTDVITAGFLLAAGHYDVTTLARVVFAAPFMLLGVWMGTHQFIRTPSATFKLMVRWLLLGFCAFGIFQLF